MNGLQSLRPGTGISVLSRLCIPGSARSATLVMPDRRYDVGRRCSGHLVGEM